MQSPKLPDYTAVHAIMGYYCFKGDPANLAILNSLPGSFSLLPKDIEMQHINFDGKDNRLINLLLLDRNRNAALHEKDCLTLVGDSYVYTQEYLDEMYNERKSLMNVLNVDLKLILDLELFYQDRRENRDPWQRASNITTLGEFFKDLDISAFFDVEE